VCTKGGWNAKQECQKKERRETRDHEERRKRVGRGAEEESRRGGWRRRRAWVETKANKGSVYGFQGFRREGGDSEEKKDGTISAPIEQDMQGEVGGRNERERVYPGGLERRREESRKLEKKKNETSIKEEVRGSHGVNTERYGVEKRNGGSERRDSRIR
jgi:hypothetical protein